MEHFLLTFDFAESSYAESFLEPILAENNRYVVHCPESNMIAPK